MKDRRLSISHYPVYKDSGFEWLGNVPEHWNLLRIKSLTKTKSGTTPKSGTDEYYENGIHFWVRTTDLNNNRLYSSEFKVTTLAIEQNSLSFIQPKSILLAMYGGMGTIGKNSLLEVEVTINQSVCAIFPNHKQFNSEYLWYYTQFFRPHWEIFADSARKDPNINQEAIKRLWVVLPSLPEQKAIAHYLDTKTAQIDRKIDLLTQKAEQYGNLKQSLINETVMRGLDRSVSMKDSGIEWIGNVPEHWEILRIKDYTYVKGRIGWQGLRSADFLDRGEFYCITGTDLLNGSINWLNCYFVSQERYEQDKYIKLKEQDLLITKDGTIGKIALVQDLPLKTTLNSGVFVTRPKKDKYTNKFMYWLLNSSSFKDYIELTKGGSTIQHLYQNVFDRFLYGCPPLSEQQAIADYLDTKTAQIDRVIQTINTQIGKLKELRKTLINDVVTGKIKVV
ncbi:restriction endonuclease subunit S [Chamaesiphon sp.]|uniref:restriction endonuclease subunit S n=1 Tax=Chamaesiphon sp. TaxID=2814140 RepID=UPI0035938214